MSQGTAAGTSGGASLPAPILPPALRLAGLLVTALAAAGLVVSLQYLEPGRQEIIVGAVALAAPAIMIFLIEPIAGLWLYLALLPLVATGEVFGGINGGEALTFGVLLLGGATAWSARARLGEALSALRPILWPLVGLAAVSVASLLVNEATSAPDLLSAFLKILAFGLVPLLVYLNAGTERRARLLLGGVLVGGLAEAVYAIVHFSLGLDYYETWDYHRAAGTFTDWNHLGGFMALVSMPTLGFALTVKRAWLRWSLMGAFVAQIVALLLSLTLGSILGLVVGGILGGLFLFRIPVRRIAGAALGFGIVFLAVIAFNPFLQEKVTRVGERVMDRVMTYSVGVAMMEDNLWFGFGSQSRVLKALYDSLEYQVTGFGLVGVLPHASLLFIGVEKGIFGVLFYLLLLGGILLLLGRHRATFHGSRYGVLYQGLVVGMLAFLVQDMTNNLLLHARLGILFFSLLAVTLALGNLLKRAERPGGEAAASS